jgi:hypothetical protein
MSMIMSWIRIRSLLLLLLVVVFTSEALSAFYLTYFEELYFYRPIFIETLDGLNWRTEKDLWGAWHKANGHDRNKRACFDVAYSANSIGARDIERSIKSDGERIIVLGDSFIEGYGVEARERLSNRLEISTKREFLNFGSSMNFGPLQYQILYSHLAKRYSHDVVLIGFLPDNDFTDNDQDFWRATRPVEFFERYRPYIQRVDDGKIDVAYTRKAPSSEESPHFRNSDRDLFKRISHYFWTTGFIGAMRYRFQYGKGSARIDSPYRNGYNEKSKVRFENARTIFINLRDEAKNKKIIIFSIPTYSEVLYAKKNGMIPYEAYLNWFNSLKGDNIEILDLLPFFMELNESQLKNAYLSCDGHWSDVGNKYAADVIQMKFFK